MTTEHQGQRGQQWLTTLLGLAGLPSDVQVTDSPNFAGESCCLTIADQAYQPEQTQALIGHDGEVLDAIQYLANTTLNLGVDHDSQGAFTIELAGYRARRYVELQELAQAAVEQVRQTGEEYEMTSLSSAERRQLHTLLKASEDLETFSRGQEPHRHLVVRLKQDLV